jgi:hypothetical protein
MSYCAITLTGVHPRSHPTYGEWDLYGFSALNLKCPLTDLPLPSVYRMGRPSGMDFTRWGEDNVFIDVSYTQGIASSNSL